MGFDWGQLARDVINPVGAVVRQTTGNRALEFAANPTNAIAGAAVGGAIGGGQPQAGADYLNAGGQLTPAQSAAARNADFTTGQARWGALTGSRPDYAANLARYKDMSQGLNAQEMTAAREQMARGLQGQEQGAMRRLYSGQARSGIRGGMAGAQQVRLAQSNNQQRQAAEQKLLLDNFAIRRQGLADYSGALNRDISGELATGMGEAQLGVTDRTAAQQAAINAAAMQANGRQSGGLLSSIFNTIF